MLFYYIHMKCDKINKNATKFSKKTDPCFLGFQTVCRKGDCSVESFPEGMKNSKE